MDIIINKQSYKIFLEHKQKMVQKKLPDWTALSILESKSYATSTNTHSMPTFLSNSRPSSQRYFSPYTTRLIPA